MGMSLCEAKHLFQTRGNIDIGIVLRQTRNRLYEQNKSNEDMISLPYKKEEIFGSPLNCSPSTAHDWYSYYACMFAAILELKNNPEILNNLIKNDDNVIISEES